MSKRYFPSQVIFETAEQRKKVQEFVKAHFGRSFSEQCRYMIMQEMREQNTPNMQADA